MRFCFLRFLRFISFFQLPCCSHPISISIYSVSRKRKLLPCCSHPMSTYSVSKKRKLKEVDDGGKSVSETNDPPQTKHDVFVSFRGEEIRDGFLSHLIKAFDRKNIKAFVDDQLERGDEIWPSLVEAIERSSISLIIFSPNYASSRWCLEEVVKILDSRDKYQRIVIPVFYHVDPTSVRHQTESYKNSFAKHGKKYDPSKVQIWRDALKKSSLLAGIESKRRNDAEVVEEVVDLLLKTLPCKYPVNSKGLVGIDRQMADVERLLHQESDRPLVIGIWGMGGIGKTTIATEVYNKLQSKYDGCYFLQNVREESRQGIISLKEKLFSKLLGEVVKIDPPNRLSNDIKRRIDGMKVLIVLDDVNDSDHIENLLSEALDWLGSESRIIVTTRDKQVLSTVCKADDIHKVGGLSPSKALELFNLNAFNQSDHMENEYRELSKRVVCYARGIPLVLKVLGRLLHGKDKEVWESQLNKLEKMPNKKVYDVMRLSYDDLDRKDKKIFLDLACFFIRSDLTVGDIKSSLRDGESDNSLIDVFERLKDKALVTFSEDNRVSMHDIIREMAFEIVREESCEDPGSRSRLWDDDDCREVLENDKGTEAIRSIRVLNWMSLKLSPHAFAKMSKLQFLEFRARCDCPQGLQSLSSELRYLGWYKYPSATLPQNFFPEKLVILNLSYCSKIIKLWDGVQNLVNLKQVILNFCDNLLELPDFSKATNLQVLEAKYCRNLSGVHSSIFSLNKLNTLDLYGCIKIATLTSDTHLSSLSYLNLDYCDSLKEFSMTSENMKEMDLSGVKVRALPSSFEHQSKLEILCLRESDIEELPSCMKKLTRLQYLDIRDCLRLQTIPELPPSLQTLLAGCTYEPGQLETVCFPRVAEQLKENRKRVQFWNCSKLDEQSLTAIELNALINVMKFAHQHLIAPKHVSDSAVYYVYPGSRVPEWLEHRTTEDSILIDLSSTPPSPHLAFIFCFLLEKHRSLYSNKLLFKITISDSAGEGNEDKGSATMCIHGHIFIDSDHVCLMYSQRCSDYLNSRATDLTTFNIKVTRRYDDEPLAKKVPVEGFGDGDEDECEYEDEDEEWSGEHVDLKGFGVSLINPLTYQSFIKQME